MASTKKQSNEAEVDGALEATAMESTPTGREIIPIGLIVMRDQIEGIQSVHRLVTQMGFDDEAPVNEFPAVRIRSSIVTDLRIALRTSPLIIDSLLDAQENKELPNGVSIITDEDDEDEPSSMLDRCIIVCKNAGSHIMSDEETQVTLLPAFIEMDKKNKGELSTFVDRMIKILDKLNEDSPMVLSDKTVEDDDMLSSPVGRAALVEAGSTEARRMTEKREMHMANFKKGLRQLTKVLNLEEGTSAPVNYYSNPQLGDYIDASFQVGISKVLMGANV